MVTRPEATTRQSLNMEQGLYRSNFLVRICCIVFASLSFSFDELYVGQKCPEKSKDCVSRIAEP